MDMFSPFPSRGKVAGFAVAHVGNDIVSGIRMTYPILSMDSCPEVVASSTGMSWASGAVLRCLSSGQLSTNEVK